MKPAAPDAGKRRLLRAGLVGAAGLLLDGCLANAPLRGDLPLAPQFSLAGARLILRTRVDGSPQPDSLGTHQPFAFPVAVAASLTDIYIADAGLGRLFRYDRSLDAMAIMPERVIGAGTRLAAGPDGSLYVLDPHRSEIRRYTRGGQPLPTLRPRQITSRYTEFAIHPLTGRAYAVDSVHRCIDQIEPLGNLAIEYLRQIEPGPLLADGRGLLLAGAGCRCVDEWIEGRAGRRYGGSELPLARALAQLGPHLYAIAGDDRSLLRLHEDGAERIAPARLGLLAPEALAAASGLLLVADGAASRIHAFSSARRHA